MSHRTKIEQETPALQAFLGLLDKDIDAGRHLQLRISAIVDACFRLIVDGESVLPWRRWGSAQELV